MTSPTTDEALTPTELLLYNHFRYLDCPAPVDPVDTDDCASMAVEVLRFLREHGIVLHDPVEVSTEWAAWCHGEDRAGIRLSAQTMSRREQAVEWAQSKIGEYGIVQYTIRRREHHRFPEGSRFVEASTAWETESEGP